MKKWILILTFVLLTLSGCTKVEFINHEKPNLAVEFTPFENMGCPLDQYGYRRCQESSALYTLGCDLIKPVSDLLGGLDPLYPMAKCVISTMNHPEISDPYNVPQTDYIFNAGGPLPDLVRYVIYKDGEVLLIKNPDEFREVFAPVESANEALSFTLAMKDYAAYYGLEKDNNLKYYVDTIEDSHVETTADGFIVHVFHYKFFGCGPHYTTAFQVNVTRDGMVEEISRENIYSDPSMDDLCQD